MVIRMNYKRLFIVFAFLMALVAIVGLGAAGTYLTATLVDVVANDLLYDATRDVVYASVPSTGGSNGNSIVRIDPAGAVGDSVFVGSEPNVLAQSGDGRFLYGGIDGAGAFRRVDLTDDSVGPLWSLGSGFCGLFAPAILK